MPNVSKRIADVDERDESATCVSDTHYSYTLKATSGDQVEVERVAKGIDWRSWNSVPRNSLCVLNKSAFLKVKNSEDKGLNGSKCPSSRF